MDINALNRSVIEEFRANGGKVGGPMAGAPLLLLTTKAETLYTDFRFAAADTLMVGRETEGVPEAVHAAVDARLLIPMRPGLRSLNVALAAAMVLGEALRQTGGFPVGASAARER